MVSPMLIIAIVNVIILKGFFISSENDIFFVKVKHFFNWYEMFTSLI